MSDTAVICPTCKCDVHKVPGCVGGGYALPHRSDEDVPCHDCAATPGYSHHLPPCTQARCRLCPPVAGEPVQAYGCEHWEAQVDALELDL